MASNSLKCRRCHSANIVVLARFRVYGSYNLLTMVRSESSHERTLNGLCHDCDNFPLRPFRN